LILTDGSKAVSLVKIIVGTADSTQKTWLLCTDSGEKVYKKGQVDPRNQRKHSK
jgi:hypothetical protein